MSRKESKKNYEKLHPKSPRRGRSRFLSTDQPETQQPDLDSGPDAQRVTEDQPGSSRQGTSSRTTRSITKKQRDQERGTDDPLETSEQKTGEREQPQGTDDPRETSEQETRNPLQESKSLDSSSPSKKSILGMIHRATSYVRIGKGVPIVKTEDEDTQSSSPPDKKHSIRGPLKKAREAIKKRNPDLNKPLQDQAQQQHIEHTEEEPLQSPFHENSQLSFDGTITETESLNLQSTSASLTSVPEMADLELCDTEMADTESSSKGTKKEGAKSKK